MKTMVRFTVFVVVGVLLAGAAYAQFAKPEDAIKYRQASMYLIGQHFGGRMGAVVKDKQPYNAEEFARSAALVETLAKLAWEAFLVPGSAEGETKLKPEALQAPDKFKAAAAQMETAMAKLVGLAKGGDMKAIKVQFGEIGKSCKGCHEQFKAK